MQGALSAGAAARQRWAALSAVAAVAIFAVANALWAFEQPAPDAPASELVAFYTDLSGRVVAGGLGSLLSIAIFVVFAAALHTVLVDVEGDAVLANAAFGGAILGLAAGIGAETINMAAAIRAGDGQLTEDLALALFDISYVLGSYGTGIGLGVMTLAIGAAALRSGRLLPRWLAVVAIAIGVAMVTPLAGYLLGEYTVAPCFAVLATLGGLLLRGRAVDRQSAA